MLKELKKIKPLNIILLTFGGIINAAGVTVFLSPVGLYDTGISGTSMLLSQLTPSWMNLSLFLIVLNIPLFLYGLKKQGVLFTFYSIYTVGIFSLSAWIMTDFLSVDTWAGSPLAGKDLLLCAVFGGIISGIGSGIALRFSGVIDGIEVIAVILSKKIGISVSTFVMIYNVILYTICGFAIKSFVIPLYSIITYAAALKTIDFIVDGIDRSKCAMIVTVKPDEICDSLSEAFESGMTRISARGGYSGSEKTVIHFVVNRFQVTKMKDIVHEIDPTAYIAISDVADVFSSNIKE